MMWIATERAPANSRKLMPGTWNVWSIMMEGYKELVSLTGGAETVNAQGSDNDLVID